MSTNSENFNADELEAPKWLNKEFLAEVLAQHENANDLKVIGANISPASAKGDHYASIMFRASVEYECQNVKSSKSLIIKAMPELEGQKKDLLANSHIFATEIGMYTEVLPEFERILREADDDTRLCVPCIYHTFEPRQVMVFEDLVSEGYAVLRDRSPNIEELRVAFCKLAKWQAVSYKILKENPSYFDKYKHDLTTLPNYLDHKLMREGLPIFLDMISHVPQLKKYKKYFEQMQENFGTRWVSVIRQYWENRLPNAYYVLCHGDFHLRNIMFKNNKDIGASEDCMLLDFQLSNVGPITNDILYGIYLLFGPKERKEKRDELIYYYFSTFSETLKKIGYQGTEPSLVEFRQQLFDNKYEEFFLLTTFLPCIIAMCKEPIDFGELLENDELSLKTYYDEDFIAELEYILPQLLHLEFFENL